MRVREVLNYPPSGLYYIKHEYQRVGTLAQAFYYKHVQNEGNYTTMETCLMDMRWLMNKLWVFSPHGDMVATHKALKFICPDQIKQFKNYANQLSVLINGACGVQCVEKIQNNMQLKHDSACRDNVFWGNITREQFNTLPPITAIQYKQGLFVIDGQHRSACYCCRPDLNLRINVLD